MFSNAIIPSAQFRAIILCGYGSDLFPLIEPQAHSSGNSDEDPDAGEGDLVDSDDSEEDAEGAGGGAAGAGGKVVKGFKVNEELRRKDVGQIKSLLPVAGRRMIDWVLDLVEEAGVYGTSPSLPLAQRRKEIDKRTDRHSHPLPFIHRRAAHYASESKKGREQYCFG